ncbi:hypothetical protein LCGC14_1601280, partial [marine sediment metagenome]
MPEEAIINDEQNQITYNVVLDPSDIARQAEEIRNQLDLALGVGSNAGTQFINTTDFINPQFAPLPPPSMVGMEGQFGGTFDQEFWKRTQDQMSGIYNNLSAGLERVRQDISMLSDRGGTIIQGFQPAPTPQNPYQGLLPDTFGEQILASLGFGGNLAGPIAPSTYQRYGQARLTEGAENLFQNPGAAYNEFTSTTLGMAANIGGYLLAPGAMLATDIAMLGDEFLSGAYNRREDLAVGISEIAVSIPKWFISVEKIAEKSQLPLEYVNGGLGLIQARIPYNTSLEQLIIKALKKINHKDVDRFFIATESDYD